MECESKMSETAGPHEAQVSLLPEVFSRYGKLLARSIARLVKPHDVEDIVQETYVRVFQAAKKRPIRSPQAFMLTTARNLALDKLSVADALNHVASSPQQVADDNDDDDGEVIFGLDQLRDECTPDRVLEGEQEFVAFCRSIRGLPRQCRRAFLLRKVYGLSQREVAVKLGVTEGTVEKHIAKAMLECVRFMQANGYAQRQGTQTHARRARAMS
jgi:RNA polymerase sigma-70 factor (ECF subfamily)